MGNIASSRTLDAKAFKKQVIHAPPARIGRGGRHPGRHCCRACPYRTYVCSHLYSSHLSPYRAYVCSHL